MKSMSSEKRSNISPCSIMLHTKRITNVRLDSDNSAIKRGEGRDFISNSYRMVHLRISVVTFII